MAVELGAAFVSVTLETSKLAGDIRKTFTGAGSDAESAGKSVGSKFGGAVGLAAAAVGALGIGSFFKSAVSGAGQLEQSVGAVNAIFAGSAGQMHEWSKSAATDVGLTQNEFNELGTLIGSQLKNGGTAMDELAPKTKNLIGTGADLASMFGGTTADAVGALSSALKGERDPIERYGVSLSQAKIDAEAAALGFAKVGGSLSAEANQAATLSLIMKQTADAHGNFASEADTLAGKQQRLNAVWENGKTQIGAALLPAVSALTGAMLTGLGPALVGAQVVIREVIGGFTAFGAAFRAADGDITSSGFAGVMEHIGFAASKVADIGKTLWAGFKMPPEIAAGFGSNLNPLLAIGVKLREFFSGIGPVVAALVPPLFALFAALSPTSLIFQALLPVLPQIAGAIGSVIQQILPLVVSLTSQLLPIVTQLVTAILPPLSAIFTDIVTAIVPLVTVLMAALIPAIEALLPVVVTVFSFVADLIKNVMQAVQGVIQVVTGIITGDWDKVWTGLGNIFGAVWNNIQTIVTGAIAIVGSLITMGMSNASRIVGGALEHIGRFFSDTWSNVVNGVSGMIGNVLGFFGDLGGKIVGAMGNIGSTLFNTGKNIIQGLIDGIGSMMGSIGRAVISIVPEAIRGPFEDLLGIHSPSRVFREYGVNIGQGLILGIDGMHGKVASSVTGLVNVPAAPNFSAGSYTPASAGLAGAGGGFTNYGPINVRDENEMARVILNKQKDAQAAYGF